MKKLISLLFCVLMLLMCSAPAYAEGNTIHIEGEAVIGEEIVIDTGIEIMIRTSDSTDLSKFPLTNGSGGGKLPDGAEISVTGAPTGAAVLVVRQIPQSLTEPYKWFKQVLGDTAMQAYEIFFYDADGNRMAATGATVKVTTPDGMTGISVYSVDPDASKAKLTANIKDGKAIFRTDGSRYYVLTGTTSSTTPGGGGGTGENPKTGDESNLMLWIVVMVVAFVGMLLCILLWKRRKKKEDEQ